jgi:hypothetical protein
MAESFKHKGQVYRRADVVPYTRKDGSTSTLQVWSSDCAECGARFEFKTTTRRRSLQYPRRRCDRHRRPGVAAGVQSRTAT